MNFYGAALSARPLVSIIIDTYYRPDMLKHAVDCLLGQTYHNIEIIIVNNGATPDTIKYLLELEKLEKKVVLVHFKENQFSWDDPQMLVRICYNAGLDVAKGELIFYQSDDDWVAFDFIERMVSLFTENHKCNTAIGRVVNARPDGTIINYYPIIKREKYVDGKDLSLDFILKKSIINQPNPGHSFVVKKDVLVKYGGFQDTFEKQQILGIVPFGKTAFDPEALMFWGRHPEQLNATGTKLFFFWDQYLLKNIENPENSFVERWRENFGDDDALKMRKYCHSTITSGYFQVICSYIFKFRIYGLYKFIEVYKKRIEPIEFDMDPVLLGMREAFLRTKTYYIFNIIYIFSNLFIKSPLNTLGRTHRFMLKILK